MPVFLIFIHRTFKVYYQNLAEYKSLHKIVSQTTREYLVGMLHYPVMRRQSKAKEIEPLKNLEDQFTCFQTAGSMPRTECCAPAVASPVLTREEEPPS